MSEQKDKGKNEDRITDSKITPVQKNKIHLNTEKRGEKRIKKKLLLNINGEDFVELAITSDISKNGLFIESANILPLNKEIVVLLKTEEDLFDLTCEVKWIKRPSKLFFKDKKGGMGVKIIEAPVEYLNYVAYTKYEPQS